MSSIEPVANLATADFVVGEVAFGPDGEPRNQPAGTWARRSGPHGPAVQFDFVEWSQGAVMSTPVRATPAWDEAAGVSFWVKGDGSTDFAAISFADGGNEKLRWEYWFSIESTEWRKITVPWREFMPLTPHAPLLLLGGAYRPSQLGAIRFGKQVWRRDCPAFSFTIAEIGLEAKIPLGMTDYTPTAGGTPRTLANLRAKEPVTVVTIGDSLTDPRHWANVNGCWPEQFATKLRDVYKSEVTLLNPAVGGHQLTHGLTQTVHWLPAAPEPDLVTVWFGGNDRSNGMTPEHFRAVLRFAVDHLRRLTRGRSEIMLLTCHQSRDEWNAMGELTQAVRDVAAEKYTGLADVYAAFSEFGAEEGPRSWLYAWDGHLGPFGHPVVAKTVYDAVAASGSDPPHRDGS